MVRAPRQFAFLVLVTALAAVACGGSGSASPASASPASASPGAASPAASPAGTATASADASGATAAATCAAPATPTTAQTEGPYFKAGSPERSTLAEAGMAGTRLTLTGFVVSTTCTPILGAVVDVWQADSTGAYDNAGYTLRGHVLTDAAGGFTFQTIVPGEYPGRTEHIHVKITPPGGATLTTQLYFPGVTANDADGIFSPDLVLAIAKTGDGLVGRFTFVVGS